MPNCAPMAITPATHAVSESPSPVRHIDLAYDNSQSEESARQLVYRLRPEWKNHAEQLEFVKFTDGITNTLLKIARRIPGASQSDIDDASILMRAYGNNTDLIIDRDREARSHALLSERTLAPPLMARFRNGLLYGFIPGKVTTPEDLVQEPVWRGVANKLGEWHARVPISAVTAKGLSPANGIRGPDKVPSPSTSPMTNGHKPADRLTGTRMPRPNLWTVVQSWVDILPADTDKEKARKELLQREVERCFQELDNKDGIGEHGLIFGHCDLLSANVIILPASPNATSRSGSTPVTFIDYEYATPCPAAFDIANHFAEWAGYDLDYHRLPTRSTRRAFVREYVASYGRHAGITAPEDMVVRRLFDEVDRFRGMPGLYWGIWALIQARISAIDFDYASYAEDRLSEYWAWRATCDGSPPPPGKAIPLREQRWHQE